MKRFGGLLLLATFLVALTACTGTAASGGTVSALKALQVNIDNVEREVRANNISGAKSSFGLFDGSWDKVEDDVKAKTKDGYQAIEDGISDVKATLMVPAQPDKAKVLEAIEKLDKALKDVIGSIK